LFIRHATDLEKDLLALAPLLFINFLLFVCGNLAYARDVTLQWDANTESDLAGYVIYYDIDSSHPYTGSGAQEGNSPIDVPISPDENPEPGIVEFTIHGLSDSKTYYFAVTAYNTGEMESGYSNVVNTGPIIPDETPPLISNVQVSSLTKTSAVMTWTTDEPSNSQVQYGTTSGSYPNIKSDTRLVINHSITLTGLNTATPYYFRVGSSDSSGNGPTTSHELAFTTAPAPDMAPPVIWNVQIGAVNDNTVVITWTSNEPSDSQVGYDMSSGTWATYSYFESDTALATSHSVTLDGLSPDTTYYFRVGSTDGSGNGPVISAQLIFMTVRA
jgi:phosphodiesterase/alkaline phosphatase D-like protein